MKKLILKGSPISTNNCYYHAGRGVTFIKPKAKALKEDYTWQARSQWKNKPLKGDVEIILNIYFGTKRGYDWDNFHKLSMDALNGIVWEDDTQVQRATIEKRYDKANPRIEVEVYDLSTD